MNNLPPHSLTSHSNTPSPRIFAFSGKSNSGKTTLIYKLCEYFTHILNLKVAVIKHDPKDKAVFDTKGKDSYKFFQIAQAVAVISPTRTTLQLKNHDTESKAFDSVLKNFQDYDYIFVEGLKTLPYPRIVVARESIESEYIPYANAFALDKSINSTDILPSTLPILDLNNTEQIAEFIYSYFNQKG